MPSRSQPLMPDPAVPPSVDRVARPYPVREYVSAMALELATMARWDGDSDLADLLERAAERARAPRP